jgi:hypothetical protein
VIRKTMRDVAAIGPRCVTSPASITPRRKSAVAVA